MLAPQAGGLGAGPHAFQMSILIIGGQREWLEEEIGNRHAVAVHQGLGNNTRTINPSINDIRLRIASGSKRMQMRLQNNARPNGESPKGKNNFEVHPGFEPGLSDFANIKV